LAACSAIPLRTHSGDKDSFLCPRGQIITHDMNIQDSEHLYTNELIHESSPYLLQHAHNPVNWNPWGEEALQKARQENKMMIISIGYAACHWCHVMEKESFEDEQVAQLMNESFISIKVDREERPDIDGIYMSVCRMLTSSGGWPLTIVMTPDKKPFFAGTYFPKRNRFNRIGMLELIPRLAEVWKTKRGEIEKSANEIVESLNQVNQKETAVKIDESIFEKALFEVITHRLPDGNGEGVLTATVYESDVASWSASATILTSTVATAAVNSVSDILLQLPMRVQEMSINNSLKRYVGAYVASNTSTVLSLNVKRWKGSHNPVT